jgi:hypothetical protein
MCRHLLSYCQPLLFSIALLASMEVSALAETPSVEQFLLDCHAVVARLKSVDFVFSFESEFGTQTSRLREQNGKYRADAWFEHYVPGAEGEHIHTYDKDRHQNFTPEDRVLGLVAADYNTPQTPMGDPLYYAYEWVLRNKTGWHDVKNVDNWLSRAPICELRRAASEQGAEDANWELVITPPVGGYAIITIDARRLVPLAIQYSDREKKPVAAKRVDSWQEYPTPDGPVYLPMVLQNRIVLQTDVMPGRRFLQVIDPSTVRINEPIDEAIFTIPLSRADEIIDMESGEMVDNRTGIVRPAFEPTSPGVYQQDRAAGAWWAYLPAALLVLGAVAVGLAIWHRRR